MTTQALETLPNCLASSKTPSLGLIIFSATLDKLTLLYWFKLMIELIGFYSNKLRVSDQI